MKLAATLIASMFAVTAFAAEPAKKEAKPTSTVVAAPVAKPADPKASTPATKSEPAKKEVKAAEPAKK